MKPDPGPSFESLLQRLEKQLRFHAYKLAGVANRAVEDKDLMQVARFAAWRTWKTWSGKTESEDHLYALMMARAVGAMQDELNATNWTKRYAKGKVHMASHDPLPQLPSGDEPHQMATDALNPEHYVYASQMVANLVRACMPFRDRLYAKQQNKRDMDVLQLVAQGFETAEIADVLGISNFRVNRILHNIRTRAENLP